MLRLFPLLLCLTAAVPARASTSVLLGEIDDDTVDVVASSIEAHFKAGEPTVVLQLTSPGGSIFAGFRFIQRVEQAKKTVFMGQGKVVCVVDMYAASMAAVILESPVCDLRLMTPRSILLFHNGATVARGTAKDIESSLNFLRALDKAMAHAISERLGMSYAQYRAMINGKDWTMDCGEALAVGAVDGLIDPAVLPPVGA